MDKCVCIIGLLCCMPKMNTALYVKYIFIKLKETYLRRGIGRMGEDGLTWGRMGKTVNLS